MTISQAISQYSKLLKSSSPILDIELLLTKTLNKPKEYLYEYPEGTLTTKQILAFEKIFRRRQTGEPIAYILGHKEFYNLDFKVNKSVLIPRPETEMLVEEAINYCQPKIQIQKPKIQILEIGVGSGAIIISITKNLKNVPSYASDISSKALNIAKQNAKAHKVRIKFLKGNLLYPFLKFHTLKLTIQNSIIVTNLPYLDQKEKNLLPSSDTRGLKFEPKIAWDGGADGLKYFREFFQQIKTHELKPLALFLEIGHNQGKALKKIANSALTGYNMQIIQDLCGHDRVVKIVKIS